MSTSNIPLLPEPTIHYQSWLLRSVIEGLTNVYENHPDDVLKQHINVSMEMPMERAQYPSIVVRYYERDIFNAGVGHIEQIKNPNGQWQPYKHYLYKGDLELAIYALSSYDRVLLADSIVQIIAMGDLEQYSNFFYQRIYDSTEQDAIFNFININTDRISGFGNTQTVPPWMTDPNDRPLVYQTSYRSGVYGEFYSRPLETAYGKVEQVPFFPYFGADEGGPEQIPTGNINDTTPWIPFEWPQVTTDDGFPDPTEDNIYSIGEYGDGNYGEN